MQRSTRRSRAARLQATSSKTSRSRSDQQMVSGSAEVPSNATSAGGFFSGSRDFIVNNPTIYNVQGDIDIVAQGMKALSKRVIDGTEYDSSARDPPPQCHPGTRVQLNAKINTWFHDKRREKAVLWLNGPAGVGKSAVIQTFAESLAETKSLGGALFFSRLNDRNDPRRAFLTIAFQLATRIPSYRIYITEQIVLDPSLLKKGMKEQFQVFVTEPFGNKKIGEGEGPWGVLLDGLDECEGVEEQCKIVELVSAFVLDFPDAPLVWVIASRPEPHIVATFNDAAVAPSHWSEYIPINSTGAYQDVERYLNASFNTMRKRYSHIPSDWPSETQFVKLANGALGLFVFARTAVRFLEDPNYADPVSRLSLLVSIIDHLDIEVTDEHPFALLDALYTHILTPIPPSVWCITKRILGFVICAQSYASEDGLSYPLGSSSLMGASIILGIERSVIYGSLHKLHSVLQIPHSKNAHKREVSFLHASFGDYLTDRVRSKNFHIDRGEMVDDITHLLFQLYLDKPWENKWERYTSQLPRLIESDFFERLREDAETSLYYAVTGELRSRRGRGPLKLQQDRLECLEVLRQTDLIEVCELSDLEGKTIKFLLDLWNKFRGELVDSSLFEEVLLQDLKIDHLDHEKNTTARIFFSFPPGDHIQDTWAHSPTLQKEFATKLRNFQERWPDTVAVICGNSQKQRVALIYDIWAWDDYYCFPYVD